MGSDCEQRRSPALAEPSSKESLSPEAAAGAQDRAGNAAVAEAVAPVGEPSDPKVDAARLRAAMGDRDELTYAILQIPLRARMVAAAAAYGPSFSADIAETIGNAKDYEVVRSFLVGSIDPVVELGFRAGLLSLDGEGVLQTVRDLTPAQLARFAEDPASRQAFEDKLVEIVGWVHLLDNDQDLLHKAHTELAARIAGVEGGSEVASEMRVQTAATRIIEETAGFWPNWGNAFMAFTGLNAEDRKALWPRLSPHNRRSPPRFADLHRLCDEPDDGVVSRQMWQFADLYGDADATSIQTGLGSAAQARAEGASETMDQAIGAVAGADALAASGGAPLTVALLRLREVSEANALIALVDGTPPSARPALLAHPDFGAKLAKVAPSEAQTDVLLAFGGGEGAEITLAIHELEVAWRARDLARLAALCNGFDPQLRAGVAADSRFDDLAYEAAPDDADVGFFLYGALFRGQPIDPARLLEIGKRRANVGVLVEGYAGVDRRAAEDSLLATGTLGEAREAELSVLTREERFAAEDALLGAPDPLDPDQDFAREGELLLQRLERRLQSLGWSSPLADLSWATDNAVESGVEFLRALQVLRATPTHGAYQQLCVAYFEAVQDIEDLVGSNRAIGDVAATVAGIAAGIVVIVVSGGALSVPVLAAVAGAGGAASALGGLVGEGGTRTSGQVAEDFAVGAVEGALTVVGGALAARAVVGMKGATLGAVGAEAAARGGARGVAAIVEGAIDGAIGGAGGEVLQTALDESTWDMSVAAVLSSLAVAALQGAAVGAVTGGVVSGVGDNLAHALPTSAAKRAAGGVADTLAHALPTSAAKRAAGGVGDVESELAERWFVRADDGHWTTAEAQAHFLTKLGDLPKGAMQADYVHVLEADEFTKRFGHDVSGYTEVLSETEVRVYFRADATESVLDEEAIHVEQFFHDPKAQFLSQAAAGAWPEADVAGRAETWKQWLSMEREAVDVEIADLSRDPEMTDALADALLRRSDLDEVAEQLDAVAKRLKEAPDDAEILAEYDFLQDFPRLHGKRLTWAERLSKGKSAWESADKSSPLARQLEELVQSGEIREGVAGQVAQFGDLATYATTGAPKVSLEALCAPLRSGNAAGVTRFREGLREAAVARAIADEARTASTAGTGRSPILDALFAAAPNNATQGALFTAYRRAKLAGTEVDAAKTYRDIPQSEKTYRIADDVANVHIAPDPDARTAGISGRMLVDDKSGSSFDIKQAQDYAKIVLGQAKGPRVDGMMYVFDSEAAARAAADTLKDDDLCKTVFRSKLRVAFFDANGKFQVYA